MTDFSELIEYLDVKFLKIDSKFEAIDKKFDAIDKKFDAIEGKLKQFPTKAYLDNKLAELAGRLGTQITKSDSKVNRLAEILKDKKIITESEFIELNELKLKTA